jgi:hypothetical protein
MLKAGLVIMRTMPVPGVTKKELLDDVQHEFERNETEKRYRKKTLKYYHILRTT